MNHLEQMEELYSRRAKVLETAYRSVDPDQFGKAVRLLSSAARIAASGCGQSGIACMHFVHLLCCIERPARFLYPSEALHGGLGFLLRGDVMVLCSIAGRTAELLAIEETCRAKDVHVIAVTEDLSSPLARRADILLRLSPASSVQRACAHDTTSFALETMLFDALQSAILSKLGCTVSQYAIDHPEGAAGVIQTFQMPLTGGPSD